MCAKYREGRFNLTHQAHIKYIKVYNDHPSKSLILFNYPSLNMNTVFVNIYFNKNGHKAMLYERPNLTKYNHAIL